MAHGYYDYGVGREVRTVHATPDMAEHAVRLGAISSIDRRGNVVWWDDFEGAIPRWLTLGVGAGYSVALSQAEQLSGTQSMKLVGGSDGTRLARIERYLSRPVLSRIGFETAFSVDTNVQYMEFQIRCYTGTRYLRGYMRLNIQTGDLDYWGTGGAYVTLQTGVNVQMTTDLFHRIKFVIDMNTEMYVYCVLDNTIYDMSQIPIRATGSAIAEYLRLITWLTSVTGENGVGYVDDFIFTQNEP